MLQFFHVLHTYSYKILQSCSKVATQTNLLGYFGKVISRKRKSQSDITSFFKKADQNQKNDGDVVYVVDMCLYFPFYNARQTFF